VTVVAEELKAERGVVHQLETVATVPAVARIPAAEYPGRRSGAIRIRSGSLWGAEVEGLYPRDGAGAFAEATVLTFRTLSNAASYRVDIEDEVGETVFAVETRSPEVVIPKGVLVPGTEYYWRVRTVGQRESGGRGEAVFVTLSADDVRARNRIRTAAESEGSANAVLLLAEVDRSLGLFREACRALDRAADQDTGNPHLTAAQDAFNCGEYGSSE
jgi:hypothetical protein